jgi:hypothetical protein
VPLGTGTLFRIGNRHFVVSARHLFDGMDMDQLARVAIPEGPKGGIYTLGHAHVHRPKHSERQFDLALIEFLEAEAIDRLSSGWRFLTLENVAEPSDEGSFVLTGYPVVFTNAEGERVTGGLASVYTRRIRPPELTALADPVVDVDLFFAYMKMASLVEDGTPVEAPALLGASGGSLWEYREPTGGLWTPVSPPAGFGPLSAR